MVLDFTHWERQVNALLNFAIDQGSQGECFYCSWDWNTPVAKKSTRLLWKWKPFGTGLYRGDYRYKSLDNQEELDHICRQLNSLTSTLRPSLTFQNISLGKSHTYIQGGIF